jgi:hypothetical protein
MLMKPTGLCEAPVKYIRGALKENSGRHDQHGGAAGVGEEGKAEG